MPFSLASPAFEEGGSIPSDHTCDGSNLPIPLAWSGTPEGTAELALIMDDPDANGFVHWVVVGIPPATIEFPDGAIAAGSVEGQSGFGRTGYGGPCPPSGTHRYEFTLFALSSPLALSRAATAAQVRSAAAGKTIAEAHLTGRYSRQQ